MKNVLRTLAASLVLSSAMAPAQAADLTQAHRDAISGDGRSAVTVWWVIFNSPEHCFGNPDPNANCSGVDILGQPFLDSVAAGAPDTSLIATNWAARPAGLFATGAETSASGQVRLVSSLYRTDPSMEDLPDNTDPFGLGGGYVNERAEVHLVVRDHGAPINGDLVSQLVGYLDPHCADPRLQIPGGPNVCRDKQFAIFGPDESGSEPMRAFATGGGEVPRSRAILMRDAGVLRAVIETQISSD
ncbi:MAG: hypothetical protein AAFU65_12995 [Pseudomonadota bacterium]